ncbi:MAG: hypothetical protein GQF41_1609 [Candidatus Rifleibacterium amylolyticum]|nr:MAG: hypothetical protein GQF41_1609 [Candidatus Rifleibacterium amylolyticum]
MHNNTKRHAGPHGNIIINEMKANVKTVSKREKPRSGIV